MMSATEVNKTTRDNMSKLFDGLKNLTVVSTAALNALSATSESSTLDFSLFHSCTRMISGIVHGASGSDWWRIFLLIFILVRHCEDNHTSYRANSVVTPSSFTQGPQLLELILYLSARHVTRRTQCD